MHEIDLCLNNHILWKNICAIKTSMVFIGEFLPKLERLVHSEHLSGGVDWELQESMLAWPVMCEVETSGPFY